MKLLKTFKDTDIFPNARANDGSNYTPRPASRAVLFDKDDKIAFMHVTKYNYHKLPGGGVDKGETLEQALEREVLEEAGCKIKIGKEIGEIVEYRDLYKTKTESYCWIGEVVGDKGEPNFVDVEIEGQFKLTWVTLDEAIELIKKDKPAEYQGHFIIKRDLLFLIRAKELLFKEGKI